jgi:tetratricopeptide (TPR) repeat protein
MATSGALGGVAFRVTVAFRRRIPASPWLFAAAASGAALLLFAYTAVGVSGVNAEETMLGDFRFLFLFALSAMIASSIVVDVTNRERRVPGHDVFTLTPSGFRYGTLIVGISLVAIARQHVLARTTVIGAVPRSQEDARTIITEAESIAVALPQSGHAQLRYGLALSYLDRHEEAVTRLEEAVRIDSGDALTQSSLGWVYMRAGRYAEALPRLQRAVEQWPDEADSHHNVAWTLLQLERVEEAVEHYKVAVRLDSTHAGMHAQLGWALYRLSNESDALVHVMQALELEPGLDETHALAGAILQSQAKFAEARDHFRDASRVSPERADFWALAGIASYLMKDIASARKEFDEAWRRDSTYFARSSFAADMRRDALRAHSDDAPALQAGQPAKDGQP